MGDFDMSQEMARELFERGAFLLFLDFPEGSEFGIDYKSWTVGPKFRGLKMIPPGVHFVFYSARTKHAGMGGAAPRIGFFHNFREKELMVKRWDKKWETLQKDTVDENEVELYRSNLKNLDQYLGAYPYDTYKSWFSLSNHVTPELASSLEPISGQITAQTELVTMEAEASGQSTSVVDREHRTRLRFADEQGLPIMRVKPGHELRFHSLGTKVPEGASVSERTKHSMDASNQLERLLQQFDKETDLLGEMQFAFICFLMGHVYEAFEQWKRLVHLLCSCSDALATQDTLFLQFLMTLHFQLKQCPKDFFVDIVTRDNFLTATLTNFFCNLENQDKASAALKDKGKKFKAHLTKTFKWDFEAEPDRPVIIPEPDVD